ncbi:MAG: DUF1801 domain-containing protein [Arenicellales bacterium]|nr:DUF1801 domain-containing protein [Arenicellales bacterium]
MAELKTQPSNKSVTAFLNTIESDDKRNDCFRLRALMEQITNKKARMWGESIIGFGEYHYEYASGHSGKFMLTGFSPRKQNLVVYIIPGFSRYSGIMKNLGKYKTGKSCLYLNKLDDVDLTQLRELITQSVDYMHDTYECN